MHVFVKSETGFKFKDGNIVLRGGIVVARMKDGLLDIAFLLGTIPTITDTVLPLIEEKKKESADVQKLFLVTNSFSYSPHKDD